MSVRNAHAAAEQWAAALGARAAVPRRVQRGARHPMTVSDWRAQRRVCVRLCEVERLGHAWSGGVADEHFSDPKGPDASTLIWRFVQASLGGVRNEA